VPTQSSLRSAPRRVECDKPTALPRPSSDQSAQGAEADALNTNRPAGIGSGAGSNIDTSGQTGEYLGVPKGDIG
jgi:hypothetical protein